MTDTEVKTPNKRKSPFANKNSAKKSQENEGSPAKKSKGQFPQNTPQNKKTANLQNNSTKKQNTPKGQNVQNGNPDSAKKKVKPFAGTGNMQTPKGKAGKGINQTPESKVKAEGKPNKQSPKGIPNKAASNEGKDGVKRKRNTAFKLIKQKMVEGDKSVLKSIEEKIQAIQSRGDDLSKTAKRKLKILNRLKRKIEGEATPGQQVNQNQKKVKEGNKPNQKAKKQQQVKNEPPKKKQKVMIEEEESDGDDSDEDDDEVESGEEVEEESSGEEASEEEGSEEEEEDEDEDDDESDDESEEEEAPLSKVGKNKQKGKK